MSCAKFLGLWPAYIPPSGMQAIQQGNFAPGGAHQIQADQEPGRSGPEVEGGKIVYPGVYTQDMETCVLVFSLG
ncbi:MAG: hypothetical protein ACOC3Y_05205 [Desulfohalobiaceae bacterium]